MHSRKIQFFVSMAMAFAFLSSCKQNDIKPNILFIMTDQQNAEMMSCTGNQYLSTPALDKLAARGTRFELAYSPNPVCMPSRTAMLTGFFPSQFNNSSNEDAMKIDIPEAVFEQTMGKLMATGDYNCVYGGKTHWQKGLNYENTGFTNLTEDYRDILANKCSDFLKQDHEKPFLLYASFMNPHDICYRVLDEISVKYNLPLLNPNGIAQRETIEQAIALADQAKADGTFDERCPPLRENAGYTNNIPGQAYHNRFKKPENREAVASDVYYYKPQYLKEEMTEEDWRMYSWIYHRLTEDVDKQIGIVLDALEESGLAENTIVIFTSDHGEMNGAHKKVTKSVFYDESSRVPFIIAGPGVKKGVVNKEHLIGASTDLIPTFCDYAGVEAPENIPGLSIRDIAEGKKVKEWRDFIISENTLGRMFRTIDYKYIYYKNGRHKEVLYDMNADPGEMENLAVDPQYRELMDQYKAQLINWVKETNDPVAMKYLN